MEEMTFEELLLEINCFSGDSIAQSRVTEILERRYSCEIQGFHYYPRADAYLLRTCPVDDNNA